VKPLRGLDSFVCVWSIAFLNQRQAEEDGCVMLHAHPSAVIPVCMLHAFPSAVILVYMLHARPSGVIYVCMLNARPFVVGPVCNSARQSLPSTSRDNAMLM
jgi:hypothetical protein